MAHISDPEKNTTNRVVFAQGKNKFNWLQVFDIVLTFKTFEIKMAKEICAITGGTSGLGEGFVQRFAKDGYQVTFFIFRKKLDYIKISKFYFSNILGHFLWA